MPVVADRLVYDICELNGFISDAVNKPLIGCAFHRFSLAVTEIAAYKMEIINKVQSLWQNCVPKIETKYAS